ncbi:MAG TPA: aminotransferase class I/II-fold pyridoxal phosphate-dependent enzyme [Actinomycetota bacterium]|nr:aminotransferase class I/II-fold pyridoxal phosphate-dependent enzyme [Actinomycetota bacterium]
MTHLSPGARRVDPYPFEELDRRRAAAAAAGLELIDFGVGDPRDETPAFIREALAAAITPVSSYPRAAGVPELREAIAAWVARRFEVAVDPDAHVLPILGAKELVFSLAQMVVDPAGGKDLVLCTSPGYPVPERGARFAGADVRRLPLRPEAGFWPDLDAVDATTWDRAAILWLNSPNNPTGAIATLEYLTRAADVCRRHDVLLASDEAYSELWFGDAPSPSALQTGDLTNVLAIHTLSKRSSMTGYRSGFAAGDPDLIAALRRLRPAVGVTPQVFVQRASIAAWSDETHVEAARATYGARRRLFLDLFAELGVAVAPTEGTFYLWVEVPGGQASAPFAYDLLERSGVVVAPGSYFGPEGEGYVRMAMVPTTDACERAADRLRAAIGEMVT